MSRKVPEISWKCPGTFTEMSRRCPGHVLDMSWKYDNPGHVNEISRGALLLVSDMPLIPDGIKTEELDKQVNEKYLDLHLKLGVEAMTEIDEQGEQIKHFRY